MTLRASFSDSLYDNNMQTHFKVKNFPFRPYIILYKFSDSVDFEHGYRLNELIVEDKYDPKYVVGNIRGDEVLGRMTYEDSYYQYEIKIVLQTPGIYSTYMGDAFNDTPKDFIEARLEEVENQIEFEEYCGYSFSPKLVINSGDTHFNEHLDELVHLDEVIYRGGLNDLGGKLENGSLAVEWLGVFLFEVTE